MAFFDWNLDGVNNGTDDFIEYFVITDHFERKAQRREQKRLEKELERQRQIQAIQEAARNRDSSSSSWIEANSELVIWIILMFLFVLAFGVFPSLG